MDDRLLHWITVRAGVVGVVATLITALVGPREVAIGVGLGAALGAGNLWAIGRLMNRMLHGPAGASRGAAAVTLALKFAALAGVVYLLLQVLAIDVLGLLAGFSASILMIVVGSVLGPGPTTEGPTATPSGTSHAEDRHGS